MGIGVPGDPKVNFWVSVCPGNFDNRTCAVQEHASTTFDAAGSAETFCWLFCVVLMLTIVFACLLLIYQVRVSILGVHCIGFHAFKA